MNQNFIKTIGFLGKDKNAYISLQSPEKDIEILLDADEIVVPIPEIVIKIDYPLGVPTTVILVSDESEGFKRGELALKIAKEYQRIYKEEDDAVGKTGNIAPNMFNRGFSEGPYQIWGHHLHDLSLYQVKHIKNNFFILSVDS